jgi:hypothetical protein
MNSLLDLWKACSDSAFKDFNEFKTENERKYLWSIYSHGGGQQSYYLIILQMQNVEMLINNANALIRSANVDYENLSNANTVSRAKIEKTLKATLEDLNSKILEVQTAVTRLPIHEKPRYGQVINNLKNEMTRLSSIPRPRAGARALVDMKKSPEIDYSSLSEADLIRGQKEMKAKQELDIDSLSELANRTKNTSREIGDELSLHNQLLDATQANVERTSERLDQVNKKLDRFMQAADRCSYVSLLMIILILMILILVTLFWL